MRSLTARDIQLRDGLGLAARVPYADNAAGISRGPVQPSIVTPVATVEHVVLGELQCRAAGERDFLERTFRRVRSIAVDIRNGRTIRCEDGPAPESWSCGCFKRLAVH